MTESSLSIDVVTPTQVPSAGTDKGLEQQFGAHHAVSAEMQAGGQGSSGKVIHQELNSWHL